MTPERKREVERLYDEHGAALFRFCHRLALDANEAADLVQESFLELMRAEREVAEMDSPRGWLYRVAARRWSRRRRSLKRYVSLFTAEKVPGPPQPEFHDLERALARLPDRLRLAFVLIKAEGLTYAEAAPVLGAPEGTIKSWVHDAIAALRRDLAADSVALENVRI